MISTCDVAQHVTRDVKNLSTSIGEWSVLSEVFFLVRFVLNRPMHREHILTVDSKR